ncbi:MAG: glycosyltransferase 87 family protein [Candidatus Dormibacteraeota bacterium]|nr:glycosyltransferase 87 family protein [Candidatus Dormibacteraeota bacterium]
MPAVLIVGLATRAVLVPITHGSDFTVWDLASRATLDGVNVYAHHPAYSGGPYPYFPLFLYVELPMQWLALHTGVSFTILGKLPIVAADLLATLLIVSELKSLDVGVRRQAIAAAVFFLNPLVLYNGAFYGRFDSVCVALLLVAFRAYRADRSTTWRFSIWYALAIAAKTFPIFLLPWLVRHNRSAIARPLVAVAGVLFVVGAPYIISSPASFRADLLYSADKLPGGLSWQVVLHGLPAGLQVGTGDVLLGVFVVAAVAIALVDDLAMAAAATLVAFLLLSKQVIEQYLIWPLPFLIIVGAGRRSRAARLLIAEVTLAGMLVNAHFHPFGVQPVAFNVVFAVAVAATLARMILSEGAPISTGKAEAAAQAGAVASHVAVGAGN